MPARPDAGERRERILAGDPDQLRILQRGAEIETPGDKRAQEHDLAPYAVEVGVLAVDHGAGAEP